MNQDDGNGGDRRDRQDYDNLAHAVNEDGGKSTASEGLQLCSTRIIVCVLFHKVKCGREFYMV